VSIIADSSSLSVSDLSAIVAIFLFAAGIIGGVVTYLIRRRGTTGTIDTSDAESLWKQTQAMHAQITAERDKAIEQRDRLMTAQSDQVIPILSALLSAVQQLKAVLDQRDPLFSKIQVTLNELDQRNLDAAPAIKQVAEISRLLVSYGVHIDRTAELVELLASRYGVTNVTRQ